MMLDKKLLEELTSDLGLNNPFVKGKDNPVRRCWHFSTDGVPAPSPSGTWQVRLTSQWGHLTTYPQLRQETKE